MKGKHEMQMYFKLLFVFEDKYITIFFVRDLVQTLSDQHYMKIN